MIFYYNVCLCRFASCFSVHVNIIYQYLYSSVSIFPTMHEGQIVVKQSILETENKLFIRQI